MYGINVDKIKPIAIGDNCIVGFGSVVTKNIPDGEIWEGVPAHFICTIEEYYKKNLDNFHATPSKYDLKRDYYERLFNMK